MLSGIGYFLYIAQRKLLVIIFILTACSDFSRHFIGMKIGKIPFAKYVAPDMRYEAAILSVISPTIMAYAIYMFI